MLFLQVKECYVTYYCNIAFLSLLTHIIIMKTQIIPMNSRPLTDSFVINSLLAFLLYRYGAIVHGEINNHPNGAV